jgi:hypothetical protein
VKRSALHRRTPLGRGAPLVRSARICPRNDERKEKTFARNYGPRGEAVREMPCIVPGCTEPVEACHAKPRQQGGHGEGDSSWLFPGCRNHHDEAGEYRTSQREAFIEKHRVDPCVEAERIAIELDARGLPRAEPDKVQRKRDR